MKKVQHVLGLIFVFLFTIGINLPVVFAAGPTGAPGTSTELNPGFTPPGESSTSTSVVVPERVAVPASSASTASTSSTSTASTSTSTSTKCLKADGTEDNANCSSTTDIFNLTGTKYADKSTCEETLSEDVKTITCKKNLFMGPCELLELAVRGNERRNGGKSVLSSYACTAFPDPVPAAAVNSTPGSLCIVVDPNIDQNIKPTDTANPPIRVKLAITKAEETKNLYCNAVAIQTGGGFAVIFNLVSYLFFFGQPILISVAVVFIISIGVKMMFMGGSSETVQKEIKGQLIRVLSGLALLFLIKLILVTINGGFFTN